MTTVSPEPESDAGSCSVDALAVYSHVRATDATDSPIKPGVYRVVGTPPGSVTLLRVGDADNRRVHTGDVVSVDHDTVRTLELADNPDGNRPTAAAVAGAVDALIWRMRAFFTGLAARPLASVGALALLVVGRQGDRVVSGPNAVFTASSAVGVLVLVYLGSRGE